MFLFLNSISSKDYIHIYNLKGSIEKHYLFLVNSNASKYCRKGVLKLFNKDSAENYLCFHRHNYFYIRTDS